MDIATDESLPHVVIRAFAKDAALHLLKLGPRQTDGCTAQTTQRRQCQLAAKSLKRLGKSSRTFKADQRAGAQVRF